MIQRMEVFSSRPSVPELPLSGNMASTDPVQIRNVDGLGPVKADVTSTPFATGRGELPQGSSTGKRNIVLTLGLNPDWEDQTMSTLRQLLYAYLLPESWCKLRFYTDYLPPVDIEGIVESFDPNIFSQDPEVQISILCHKPDFVDANATFLEGVVDDGTLEIEFDYIGTVETGFELRIEQTADNLVYTGPITISKLVPELQVLTVDPVTINGLKYFKATTIKNAKRVQNIAVADGALTNLLTNMTDASVWPDLQPGTNVISVAATENGQKWTLAYFNKFGGL